MRNLDYSSYPCQAGPRSLLFVSKLALQSNLQINVPPTILLGFGNSRGQGYPYDKKTSLFMYNNPSTRIVQVKPLEDLSNRNLTRLIKNNMDAFHRGFDKQLFSNEADASAQTDESCFKNTPTFTSHGQHQERLAPHVEQLICPRYVLTFMDDRGSVYE